VDGLAAGVSVNIVGRIVAAFVAGIILGAERESHGRAAGLRTTVLVSVAACMAMILSNHFYAGSLALGAGGGTWRPDPARLAAGVLTGIGFLGAGVIIRPGGNVIRGVTTASLLWFATILGLIFGSGLFLLGGVGLAVACSTLFLLPYVERFVENDWYSTLSLVVAQEGTSVESVAQCLQQLKIRVKSVEMDHDVSAGVTRYECLLRHKKGNLIKLPEVVVARMAALPGVRNVSWK